MRRRYNSVEEVDAMIERYQVNIEELKESANAKDHLADQLRLTEESHRVPDLRDKADKIRNQIAWRMGRIETLKQKRSVLLTLELPCCVTDGSVDAS